MNQNIVKVQNLGSPGIQKSEARLLPSGVEAEGAQAFFEFRGSKEGSRGFAITINHARVDGSGITRSGVDADENKTVRSSDGVFKDTKSISLLFSKEGNIGRSSGSIGYVKDLFDVLTASGSEKVTLPRIPVAILLEGLEIRNVATDAYAESIDNRGNSKRSRSRSIQRRRKDLGTVALKAHKIEIEP
jgi:hypothetical protein